MNLLVIKAAAAIVMLVYSSEVWVTADYDIHVLFYEFRNPFNLACANYYCTGDGGAPNCCHDLSTSRNCQIQCSPQFRISLKEFGTTVNHLSRHGPNIFYTGRFNASSIAFNQGKYGLFNASNPFIVTAATEWTGRVQLFIDAIDYDLGQLGQSDTIIAYGIDLELQFGKGFTGRTTYTSQVWIQVRSIQIDLSFKVQCSENYYGPSCDKFCETVEGVTICDENGNVTSLSEITTNANESSNNYFMLCTRSDETRSNDGSQYHVSLTSVFVILFALSLVFNITMVIIVIWQQKSRNTKSTELTQRKSVTPEYETVSNDRNRTDTNSISVMPNEAYESHGNHFAIKSNEPQQQNTLTNSTDAYAYYVV